MNREKISILSGDCISYFSFRINVIFIALRNIYFAELYKSVCNPTAVRLLGALFFAVLEDIMGLLLLLSLMFLKRESTKQML